MTTTDFKRDDSYGFSGRRRNIGLKMEDMERRLLIIRSLEKKSLNCFFPGHAKYKKLQYSFERWVSIRSALGTHCL